MVCLSEQIFQPSLTDVQASEWTSEVAAKKSEGAFSASQAGSHSLQGAQVETRQWSLYKAWDNTAPPKLDRIPPVYPPPGTSEIGDKIRARRGHRGLTPLDGALLNAPELAVSRLSLFICRGETSANFDNGQNGWNTHVGAVRNKNSLPGDIRELLVGTPF